MALSKRKGSSLLGWPRHHNLLSVLILIVLAAAGFFVYQKITSELNKRGFQQARRQSRRAGLRKRVNLAYSSLRSPLPLQFCKRSLAPRFAKLEKNYNY